MPGRGARSDDAVRREASDWVALIHDPEAAVDRPAFEHWRSADPRHIQAYARAERAWDSAALLGQTSFGRARGLPERQRFFDRPQVRYAFAAAAVLVVAILGFSFGTRWFGRGQTPTAIELASNIGQIRRVALTDGSTVTLDTNSMLRVAFGSKERRLYLSRGRARFVVSHDAARPFVVLAGNGSVTARGTVFDVAIADDRVKVLLLRGVIDVRNGLSQAGASQPAITRLHAGQQVAFSTAEPPANPQPVATIDTQWPAGMLSFDNTRLADAIAQANRYSVTKISLADRSLDDLRITGAYHAGDVAGLAASVADSLDLRVVRIDQDNIVISPTPAAPAI